jgi:hypothetical protein
MLCPKVEKAVDKLRLAPRFLQDFQAVQGVELRIDLTHLAGRLTNPVQDFQQLLLFVIAPWNDLLQERLESASGRAEVVHRIGAMVRGKPNKFLFRSTKDGFATVCDCHSEETSDLSGLDL